MYCLLRIGAAWSWRRQYCLHKGAEDGGFWEMCTLEASIWEGCLMEGFGLLGSRWTSGPLPGLLFFFCIMAQKSDADAAGQAELLSYPAVLRDAS